jgi:hypothetical protein
LRRSDRRGAYSGELNHGRGNNRGRGINKCNGSRGRGRSKVFGQRKLFIRKRKKGKLI